MYKILLRVDTFLREKNRMLETKQMSDATLVKASKNGLVFEITYEDQ